MKEFSVNTYRLNSAKVALIVVGLIYCCGAFAESGERPTLWIIGDSTVNNSTKDLQGWGSALPAYFDGAKIKVENRARGGRSSRSYLAEGLWDAVAGQIRKGDLVLMQFGHNDGGSNYFDEKGRASIHGTGEEIEEGDFEYGLVSDLIVASQYRKQGIGRQLLAAAESYARSSEVRWLRIGVLAENHHADGLYDSMGFKKLYIEREKELAGPK